MRILCITIAILGLMAVRLSAQEGASLTSLMANCPLLTEAQRQALPEPNGTEHSLRVPTSSLSSITFALLSPIGQPPLILTIEHIDQPIADSHISLYTSDWQPIELTFAPQAELWLNGLGDSLEYLRLEQLLYPLYLDIQLEGSLLKVTPILPLSSEDEESPALKDLIKQAIRPITFFWNGKLFQPLIS